MTMKRLARMVRMLLLFESAMYSAVTPVLPHYARTLHASKPAIGLLAAAYPAGLIPGALLGGWLAARAGVRRTTILGLVTFGLAIGAFGFASSLPALDLLRVVQGIFCGLIWGGGLTWVIAAAPADRRGATIGGVIGAATFGTLLGPVLGTLAVTAGTRPVFAATGAISLALAAWARRHDEPAGKPTTTAILTQLRAALRTPGFALGAWLVSLAAMFFGATAALLPLRLSHFGAAGWEIGAAFVAASAPSTVLSPVIGRSVDRRGPDTTIITGLALGVPLVAALVLPHSAIGLGVLIVIALGAPLTVCTIPAVSLMTDATERAGVTLLLATTTVNLAYAVGETVGAPSAAGISAVTGDGLPLLMLAALLLVTLMIVRRRSSSDAAVDTPRYADPPRTAIHTPRDGSQGDPERRPRIGDRRRAGRAGRSPAVRLGPQPASLRRDTADAGGHARKSSGRP